MNQYPDHVLNFGFTGPQNSDKFWLNLRLNCYIFTIGKTHTQYQYDYPSRGLVGLFRTGYLELVS